MNIAHNQPNISHTAQAAYDVIKSGQVAMGAKTDELEQLWAQLTDVESACAVSSGTSALRLALQALNVGEGDECIVPAYSCVSVINSVLSVGAVPVLADINKHVLTINAATVAPKLTDKTKAIIIVHLFGMHCYPLDGLKSFGIPVIEDMSHGIFTQQADLAISSFGPTKLIGSCGGSIVSGSKELIDKIKDLRTGEDKSPSTKLNSLPNDVMAVMALEQLKRLDEIKEKREFRAYAYDSYLYGYELESQIELAKMQLARKTRYLYRFVIKLKNHLATDIVQAMQDRGVMAEQPIFDYRGGDWSDLPNTAEAFRTIVSLPFHENITPGEQETVIQTLADVLK